MVHTNQIDTRENIEHNIDGAVIVDEVEPLPEDFYIQSGYQLLPLGLDEVGDNDDDSVEDDDEYIDCSPQNEDNLPKISSTDEILKSVWSGDTTKSSDIEMDNEKVKIVKEAMLNIELPSNCIPEWAKNISEDQWKDYLHNKIYNKSIEKN